MPPGSENSLWLPKTSQLVALCHTGTLWPYDVAEFAKVTHIVEYASELSTQSLTSAPSIVSIVSCSLRVYKITMPIIMRRNLELPVRCIYRWHLPGSFLGHSRAS